MRIVFFIFLSFFSISPLLAAGEKYAVVDMQQIILNVSEGKAAREKLEKEIQNKSKYFEEKKKDLEKKNKDFVARAQNASKGSGPDDALLSDDAKKEKARSTQEELMKLSQAFQKEVYDLTEEEKKFQQSIKQREAKATQEIAEKVGQIVEKIAEDKKLEVVFESSTAGVVFVKNPLNITEEVIKAYEKKHSVVAKKK